MADQTAQVLTEIGLANPQRHLPNYEYYVTDIPLRFQTIGERFLGRSLANLQQVKWG
jgi:glutamate racemase